MCITLCLYTVAVSLHVLQFLFMHVCTSWRFNVYMAALSLHYFCLYRDMFSPQIYFLLFLTNALILDHKTNLICVCVKEPCEFTVNLKGTKKLFKLHVDYNNSWFTGFQNLQESWCKALKFINCPKSTCSRLHRVCSFAWTFLSWCVFLCSHILWHTLQQGSELQPNLHIFHYRCIYRQLSSLLPVTDFPYLF